MGRFLQKPAGSAPPEDGWSERLIGRLRVVARSIPGFTRLYRRLKGNEPTKGIIRYRAGSSPALRLSGSTLPGTPLLYIVPWLQMGGADKVNLDLIRSLDRSVYRPVLVTTLKDGHPWHEEFSRYTDDIFHLAHLTDSLPGMLSLLDQLIVSGGIRLIQISNSYAGYEMLPTLKHRFGLPVLSLVHSYAPSDPWDYVRVATRYDPWIDLHITISRTLKAQMVKLGCPEGKVVSIPNGVDTEGFQPGTSDWMDRIPGFRGESVVTFLGRFRVEKQPLRFVALAEALLVRGRVGNVRFLMVGGGPQEKEVRQALQSRGLDGVVFMAGPRGEQEVRQILRATDVLVVPSLYEGLPVVGLEAMSSGVPVVATDVGGWSELVSSGENGVLVKLEDQQGLVEAVELLLLDDAKRRAMGAAARKTILEGFSLQGMAKSYQALYARFLN